LVFQHSRSAPVTGVYTAKQPQNGQCPQLLPGEPSSTISSTNRVVGHKRLGLLVSSLPESRDPYKGCFLRGWKIRESTEPSQDPVKQVSWTLKEQYPQATPLHTLQETSSFDAFLFQGIRNYDALARALGSFPVPAGRPSDESVLGSAPPTRPRTPRNPSFLGQKRLSL